MRTRTITALVAGGALTLTALGGVAVAVPGLAGAAPTATTTADPTEDAPGDAPAAERLTGRTARIAEELAGLVADGTITQDQADAVAGRLAQAEHGVGGGHGGRGGGFGRVLQEGLATAATTLGLEQDALRERLRAGETLGEVADTEGVERADLVAALVEVASTELAERVEAGDITQEQADQVTEGLTEKVTEVLDRDGPVGRGGGVRGGGGPGGGGPGGGGPGGGADGGTDG